MREGAERRRRRREEEERGKRRGERKEGKGERESTRHDLAPNEKLGRNVQQVISITPRTRKCRNMIHS